MLVNLSLSPGYRPKISRASRMSELADRVLTAVGGSAAFLEVLRRWLQRRQDKRQKQLQLDVRILEEGHALRQEAYQREREALQALAAINAFLTHLAVEKDVSASTQTQALAHCCSSSGPSWAEKWESSRG